MAVVPSIVEPVSIVTSTGVADVAIATTPSPDEPSGAASGLASPTTALLLAAGYGRRSHRKSRTGCARCKARKIKCDERHPSCLNCISHGVECPFLALKTADTPVRANSRKTPSSASSRRSPFASPTDVSSSATASSTPPLPLSPHPRPPAPPPPALDATIAPATDTAVLDYDSDSDPAAAPLPLLELELLHNFTVHTHATLAADAGVCDFWRVAVVRIGLGCDYIMRSVLAVSALHLAYHRPDRRDFYTAQGILLHTRASRSAMRLMAEASAAAAAASNSSNNDGDDDQSMASPAPAPAPVGLSDDDAVNLFLFSMLTVYFALASPRRPLADGSFFIIGSTAGGGSGGSGGGVANFPDWTFLLSGAKSLSNVVGERGPDTLLAPFLVYGTRRWHASRRDSKDAATDLDGTNGVGEDGGNDGDDCAPLRELRRRVAGSAAVAADAALGHTYAHALDELELALGARQRQRRQEEGDAGAPRDVLDAMLWLWEVSDSLVPLLKGPAPAQEAVAIFAHFCILLRHHESVWWLQGWAHHLVSSAYDILDPDHRPWIDWPMREMGLLHDGYMTM